MQQRYRNDQRDVRFEVADGHLVRTVVLPDGRCYTHRCAREAFETVVYGIEEYGNAGVTLGPLAETLGITSTQVNVALEFLKQRGCVVTRHRRNYPASDVLFEDAMTEFTFIADLPY